MSDSYQYSEPELILRFDNARPIKAAAFARVLRDLAAEYKRIYRDDLIIVALPQGSLVAKLRSFSKFAEATNHIVEFGRNLAAIAVASAVGYAALTGEAPLEAKTPLKAAQSLAKLAVESHSHLELKYSQPGKEEIILEIDPAQARQMEVYSTEMLQKKKLPPPLSLPSVGDWNALAAPRIGASADDLKSRLVDWGTRAGGLSSLDPETRGLIVALVLALRQTSPYHLTQLIKELRQEGHSGAAAIVEEIIRQPPPGAGSMLLPSR